MHVCETRTKVLGSQSPSAPHVPYRQAPRLGITRLRWHRVRHVGSSTSAWLYPHHLPFFCDFLFSPPVHSTLVILFFLSSSRVPCSFPVTLAISPTIKAPPPPTYTQTTIYHWFPEVVQLLAGLMSPWWVPSWPPSHISQPCPSPTSPLWCITVSWSCHFWERLTIRTFFST